MSSNFSSRDSSSSLFVPDALKFYVNRLSFSKNRVRLQALSSQVASSSSQIIVRLPSNTMINLASLTMTGSVRATISGATAAEGVALPTNWDYSFIETLSLIANGGIITQPFTNYKLLANTLNDIYGSNSKVISRSGLQGSLPQPLVDVFTVDATAGSANFAQQYQPFSINSWISATQTMAPSYIATNLLGDLELRLTMADTSILQTGNTTTGAGKDGLQQRANWDMKDINFYVETCSLDSVVLDQAIQAKLASGDGINVPFENVFSFSQTNGGDSYNQRFSVSSQSINKIVAISQLQSDLTPAAADPTFGQRKYVNGIPQCFRRNVCGATQCQFSINNQYSPNYQINSELNAGMNGVTGVLTNYQASSGLIETVAAMDIPDYDYDCAHKLTSTTQMPFEFLGGGAVVGDPTTGTDGYIQPPSTQLLEDPAAGVVDRNPIYWYEPYVFQSGIDTYLNDKYVVATSFDLDACDKDRVISGVNTIGSNAQLFYNVVGGGRVPEGGSNANVSNIFVICTSMVQIFAGSALKIIQ